MKLLFKKMRKFDLFRLLVIGIIASSICQVDCCKHRRSRRYHKTITTLNEQENKEPVLLPYNNANIPEHDSNDANHEGTSQEVLNSAVPTESRKTKRNSPDFSNIPRIIDGQGQTLDTNKTDPHTLIASIAHHDENTDALSDSRKIKRTPSDKVKKSRRTRDKKYMCLCEETKCRNKDCLRSQARNDNVPNQSDDDEDTSAEVLDDDNDVKQVNVIQKSSNEPKKFNIPFAHNVNFDQRVIVGAKNLQPKPPPNTFYPVYANPQIYHYTPYTLAHPGLIYTGVAPLQQNYAPAAAYNQFPSPSPIPANLLKLWKDGMQNPPMPENKPNDPKRVQSQPEYVPNYSSENIKSNAGQNQLQNIDYQNTPKSSGEPSKVTTPRQVDNRNYPYNRAGNNYVPNNPSANIEDLRPAYSYSTDFPYNDQYTIQTVSADELKFITEKPPGMRQLQFGDPTTTNYAPNFYTTQQSVNNNYGGGMNNQNSNGNGYQRKNDDLSITVDKQVDDHKNNLPTMSVPNDSDLRAYNPPQTTAPSRPVRPYNQPPDFVIQPPASYNIENTNPPRTIMNVNGYPGQSNTEMYNNAAQPATTLEDVNNGYSKHYNPQKTATLRNADGYKNNEDPKTGNTESTSTEPDHMENLFRGLEKILLNNANVSDTPQTQAIDERPSTTYENNYRIPDNKLVRNAVKKVLNNFVPGKSEDLLANYGTEKSRKLAKDKAENLSPDIVNAPVLKKLFNVPEVENMIVETTSNLLDQIVGSPMSDNMPQLIKDTLRKVINDEIPRPTSRPSFVENYFKSFVKRAPRYDQSPNREVVDKIKSIIDKSELGEEAAAHPLAQNLIVKAVKYSIDKERGAVDEATIRRTFKQFVKSKGSSTENYRDDSYSGDGKKPLIVQPKETINYEKTTTQDASYPTESTKYKLAPIVPVKERRLQGGVWVETPKNLVGNKAAKILEEKRRKELEKKLDMLQQYNEPTTTENPNNESTEKVGSPQGNYGDRDPTKYYSPESKVLEYMKNHPSTEYPTYATTSQNNGHQSDLSTREAATRFYDGIEVTPDPANVQYRPNYSQGQGYPNNPVVVTTINYQDYQNPTVSSYTTQQSDTKRLNLLVDPTDKPQSPANQDSIEQKTETERETEVSQDPAYMGKLVPLNSINGDLDNSNLVWVGDGVRLPLTMRRMSDGSYALTLSDEVCKRFVHKRCPCCLPGATQGVIVRERRNGENEIYDTARSGRHHNNEITGNYRVRRESGEVTTNEISKPLKKFSNKTDRKKWEDVNNDDYSDESDENKGPPYKYQRYANQDKIIRGRTRAIGNMLQWMKDVVTEAQQKRHRNVTSKHKVLLF